MKLERLGRIAAGAGGFRIQTCQLFLAHLIDFFLQAVDLAADDLLHARDMIVIDDFAAGDDDRVGDLKIDIRRRGLSPQRLDALLKHLSFADDGVGQAREFIIVMLHDLCGALLEFRRHLIALVAGGAGLFFQVAAQKLLLLRQLAVDARQRLLTRLLIDMGDHVLREIEHPVEVAAADIEQHAQVAGHAARVPDVRHRRGQFDMPHALAPHRGARDLDAALIADHAAVADVLVLAAVALPVTSRPEDRFTEETVFFWAQTAVVDRLRFRHMTIRPGFDLLR